MANQHTVSSDRMERLLSKRYVDPDTGCWEWLGTKGSKGHGLIWIGGEAFVVHRLMACLTLGLEYLSEVRALHKCDNAGCFNPEHLYLGSDIDNMRDRVVRNKQGKVTDLTPEDIKMIRQRLAAGEAQASIGKDYGIHQSTVSNIKTGKHWFYIEKGGE